MPEIEVRPAIETDIPTLKALDHHYTSDHVWQMEFDHDREAGEITINFRQVRLPRAVRVQYPRIPRGLEDDWSSHSDLLVALFGGAPIGYASLATDMTTNTAWLTDIAVEPRMRRQGIGSALLLAALDLADHMDCNRLVLETGLKNHPAIKMALKLGFEFCGYKDNYFPNHETGIFFNRATG